MKPHSPAVSRRRRSLCEYASGFLGNQYTGPFHGFLMLALVLDDRIE
jgi:hypothetical protein